MGEINVADILTMQGLANGHLDVKALGEAANGDENTIVTTRTGNTYPSAERAINIMFQNGGLPAAPFATKALMTASALADGQLAQVYNETANNGLYVKTAGAWVKSKYDPLAQANTYTDEKTKKIDTIVSDVELLKNGGVLVYDSSNYTPVVGRTDYSETPWINVTNIQKVYVNAQITAYGAFLVGKKTDGSTVDLAQSLTDGSPLTRNKARMISVPLDVVAVRAITMNSSHTNYQADRAPAILILGNSDDLIYKKLRELYSTKNYSGFPVTGHASSGTTTYNSTIGIPITHGMRVSYNVKSQGGSYLLYNAETGTLATGTALSGTLDISTNGYLYLSTYNSGHANYDPTFTPSYSIDYGLSEDIKKTEVAYIASEYLPTPILKTVREVHFLDGTSRTAMQYLWQDKDNKFYISSDKRGQKNHIFDFVSADFHGAQPHEFSMNFDSFGNIVCVYRIEQLPFNYTDSVRKNPIVLVKSDNYKPVIVNLGSGLKPSGWLQNCGFICTESAILFTEYTRNSVATANTWKVTYPITKPENWRAVQSFPLANGSNLPNEVKHMHSIDRDPYTGFIYISSGDYGPHARIYVSKDNGDSFTEILAGSEKYCRLLNLVFTKDFIYWATDTIGTNHGFFKAPRNAQNVLDVSNITDVLIFPTESAATYATIYMPKIDVLVFLGRHDGDKLSILIDLWDFKSNTLVQIGEISAVGGVAAPIGFRCEAFEYVPKDNEVICGYSRDLGPGGYANNLGLLGNTRDITRKVNNIILTIDRVGKSTATANEFTITYDTII